MSMQVSVFEIGGYQIVNTISVCQQTCAKLLNTRSYKKKSVPALLELPKTNQHRKTPGVRTARVLEKGLLKIPNILYY